MRSHTPSKPAAASNQRPRLVVAGQLPPVAPLPEVALLATSEATAAASTTHDYSFWKDEWEAHRSGSDLHALKAIAEHAPPYFATQARGSKQYELTDHLGNIRTVVPDIKEPLSLPQNQNFRLPTLTLNNYYPYGMLQAGRSRNAGGGGYSFSLHTPIFTRPSPTLLLNQSNTIILNALVVFR